MVKSSKRTSLRYKSLLFLLSPIALGYIFYRSIKDGGWRYFSQRLGFNYTSSSSPTILIHCASVGEVNAAKPLILELCNQHPDKNIVISTNTPTAAQLIPKIQQQNISHVYLPLDYSITVNAFLSCIDPICVLVLETEIWPTLISLTAKNNIPIAIINGRLTAKSTQASHFIRHDIESSLQNLTAILARSDEDRSRFIKIGANENSIHVIGNLKYAINPHLNESLACTTIKRPFLLAVSTHDDEEMQLVQHIEILKKENYLLVVAPRYPDRCKQLLNQFKNNNLSVAVRSHKEPITDKTDIYLIDTLGDLSMYYNEAALVFVGGSLIQRGGHNVLEPASFGKCVVVGPHTENFAQEVDELLDANGVIQITDHYDLSLKLVHLLNNDHERTQYGVNAQHFVEKKTVVLKNYLEHIQPLIRHSSN
jgi:3-deoxy-D-manno-octulosonic-acid transferase